MNNKSITVLLATITAFQGLSLLSEYTKSKTVVENNKAKKWFEAECEEIAKWNLTRGAALNFKFTRQHAPLCSVMLDKHPEWAMHYLK